MSGINKFLEFVRASFNFCSLGLLNYRIRDGVLQFLLSGANEIIELAKVPLNLQGRPSIFEDLYQLSH